MGGARAQPDREAVLERPVALSGAVRDSGLARHYRSLQADLHRRGLGADPAISHNAHFHSDLRAAGESADRR